MPASSMRSLQEVRELCTEYLESKGILEPRREADLLLQDALGLSRMQLYMDFERPLSEPELNLCRGRLKRRGEREPLAYIHGEVEFLSCKLRVSPDVLIPRQETELLADKIVTELRKQDLQGKELWDLCCGSGCLGIAIKKACPELKVCLLDISEAALKQAGENAKLNEVEVELIHGDFLTPMQGRQANFLVCNPPYITEQEYAQLEPEVAQYEPRTALVSGESGLEFYQRLSSELAGFLKKEGLAWFELGTGQGEVVKNLFLKNPWQRVEVEQDFAGHDRFFFLAKE